MKENDNINVELDKAIEKVSAEIEKENKGEEVETEVATTEEELNNDPTPKGKESEAAPTPFVPDDALTERAIRAGLSMKDVKGFSSAEFAESILSRLEAASKPNGEKAEPTGEESPAVKFDAVLKKMKEDVDEDFSRVIIEPRLDALNLRRRHLVEVRPFRELPPYHAVNILVRSALTRAIRMAVIDRRPLCILAAGAPLDAVSIREL